MEALVVEPGIRAAVAVPAATLPVLTAAAVVVPHVTARADHGHARHATITAVGPARPAIAETVRRRLNPLWRRTRPSRSRAIPAWLRLNTAAG